MVFQFSFESKRQRIQRIVRRITRAVPVDLLSPSGHRPRRRRRRRRLRQQWPLHPSPSPHSSPSGRRRRRQSIRHVSQNASPSRAVVCRRGPVAAPSAETHPVGDVMVVTRKFFVTSFCQNKMKIILRKNLT